tara:strand:+ start:2033 stop:10426 length:8394 start_codon:yes stop_codon:yes gene_type:complete
MVENKNFRQIYDFLSSQFDVGTLEQFREKMNSALNRKQIYETLSTAYDMGTYESFVNKIGFKKEEIKTPHNTFESQDVVDVNLDEVQFYNPFQQQLQKDLQTAAKGINETIYGDEPYITQIKRLKDGNFLETTNLDGNLIRESHRMKADIDPISKKPVVFPTLYPKVENPSNNPEDWIMFDNNAEAIKHARKNDELYFGYPSSTGVIPFKKLSEANKYAKEGYKKLKTYKEFNDNLFKYMQNNPGVSEEMRYITEQGIIRRAKLRAVQEEAAKNYYDGDFKNAAQKTYGAVKDAIVHDIFFNTVGSIAADIENFIAGTDNLYGWLNDVAETKEEKDLVDFYTETYRRKGIISEEEVNEILNNGIFNNIKDGITKGDMGLLSLGFNALGTQTMRAVPTAAAIMYGGSVAASSKYLRGLSTVNRLRAGTLMSATPYGYAHSVFDEYRQDKNVSGGDRIESFARGLVEGLTEIIGVSANKVFLGSFTSRLTKKERKELVDAYLKPYKANIGMGALEEGFEEYVASIANGVIDVVADGADPYEVFPKRHKEGLDQFLVGAGAGTLITSGSRILSNKTSILEDGDIIDELNFINESINDKNVSQSTKKKLEERKNKIYDNYINNYSKKLIEFNTLDKKDLDKAIDKATELIELKMYQSELIERKNRTGKSTKRTDNLIKSNDKKINNLQKQLDEITSKAAAAKVQKDIDAKTETPVTNEQIEKEKEVAEISFDANSANEASEYVKNTGFGNLLDGISNLLKSTKKLTEGKLPFKINFYNSNKNFASISDKKITEKVAAKIGGRYDKNTNTAHINLEALRDLDPTQATVTLLHEVIHPIVEAVINANPASLKPMADFAKKDADIKKFVDGLGTKNQETLDKEAVTEYLARVASGDIKPTLTTIESFKQSVINALNSIGIKLPQSLDFQIDTEQDFKNFASRLANTLKSGATIRVDDKSEVIQEDDKFQAVKEKAREVQAKEKIFSKAADDVLKAIEANQGKEEAQAFKKEYDRLVDDLIKQRQKKETEGIELQKDGKKVEKFFDDPKLDKKDEEQQLRELTETQEFKSWFGKSKAVDANGNPMVLYHGSTADWYEYDISKAGNVGQDYYGAGIYTTPNEFIANMFTGPKDSEVKGSIYPLFVSIQNPILLDSKNETKFSDEQIESLIKNSPNLESTLRNQVEYARFVREQVSNKDIIQVIDNIINTSNSFNQTNKTDKDYADMIGPYTENIVRFYQLLNNTKLKVTDLIPENTKEMLQRIDFSFYRTPTKLQKDLDGSYVPKPSVTLGASENSEGVQNFHKALNDIGYDGIFADEITTGDKFGYNVYLAFKPNQIKSIYNTGNFGLATDNILNRELEEKQKVIKGFDEKTPQTITELVRGDETKNVIVAPYFEQTVKNQKEAADVRNTTSYKTYTQSLRNLAEQMGFTALVDDIIGGYENDAGNKIVEVSNVVRLVKSQGAFDLVPTIEEAMEFASMAAALAPEVQEATIAGQYVEEGSENHNANEYKIFMGRDNIDATIEALKAAKIYNYSINEDEGSVAFIDVFDFQDVELSKKIGTFIQELNKRNVNYDKKEYSPVDSRYISRDDRQTIFKRIESTGSINEEDKPDLYKTLSLAQQRDNYTEEGLYRILTEKQSKAFYHRSLRYRKNLPIVKDSWASAFNIQKGLTEKYVRGKAGVSFGEFAEDIEILSRYNLYKSSKKVARDFHNAVLPLIEKTVPTRDDVVKAKDLADQLNKRFNSTKQYVDEISSYVSLYPDVNINSLNKDEVIQIMEEVYQEELTEDEKDKIKTNLKDIKKRAVEMEKVHSEKNLDTKFEIKAIKSFLVRQAEEIINKKTKTENDLKKYVLSDKDIELIEKALKKSTLPVDDIKQVINNLKTNRKLLGNVAKNQIRKAKNINNLNSVLKKSRKKILEYFTKKNNVLGFNITQNEIDTIDEALPRGGFSKTQIKVLNDTFENHEVEKLATTLDAISNGYMPPSTYSRILKKLVNTVRAAELIEKTSELKFLKDDMGRWIRDPKARAEYRTKEDLGWIREAVDKGKLKKEFDDKMSNSAYPMFGKIREKVVKKILQIIRVKQGTAEGYKKNINIKKQNLFKKIKFSTKFEGKEYTIRDLNILGHMYMLHKQYINNPLSNRVPELYTSLIKTRLQDKDVDSVNMVNLFNDFKKSDANMLDVAKLESLFKKSNFMPFINFARNTFDDLQDKVAYLQKYRLKEKIQLFSNYVPVINLKEAGTDGLSKAFNVIISSVFNPAAVTPAKTTISRQIYKNNDGTPTTPIGAKAHFDLDRAISFAVHETIDDYYIKEGLKDVGMTIEIGRKLGDTRTRDILELFQNMIKKKVENNYNYVKEFGGEKVLRGLATNLSLSLLANFRRFVEIGANTILLFGTASPKVNFKNLTPQNALNSYKNAFEITRIFNSAFRERFVKGGLSYFDLEKISASPLGSEIKDKKFGSKAVAKGLFEASKTTSKIIGYSSYIIRLSDVPLTQTVWGKVFESEYKSLTKQDFDVNNLKDKVWVLNNRAAMKEAINNTDIELSKVMPAVKFDADVVTGARVGTSQMLFNLFSTFRKTLTNNMLNAHRSLLGLKGGDMTKKEAIAALASGTGSIMFYSVVSAQVMGIIASYFMEWMGSEDDDEKRREKERVGWTNGLVEAILFNTSLGKWNSMGYAVASSYLRNAGRQYVKEEPESPKELLEITNKTWLSNMTYAPSYASTIHPVFQYPFSVADAIKAYDKASVEDKDIALYNGFLTVGQGLGVPHSSDLKILVGGYLKNNVGVVKNTNYGPYKRRNVRQKTQRRTINRNRR